MRCSALSCTSGYDSNPEKVHFFHVPKNEIIAKKWQVASKRTNITLNSSHCFCEKHFTEEDIIRKKQICDLNGKVVQEVEYKKVRLREGAVPSLFPWTEYPVESNKNNIWNDNVEIPIDVAPSEIIQAPVDVAPSETIQYPIDVGASETIHDEESFLTFHELQCKELSLPHSWNKNIIPTGNSALIIFSKILWKIINGEIVTFLKEIRISENMKIEIFAVGQKIDLSLFGIYDSQLKSLDDLTDIIQQMDIVKVCKGYEANQGDIISYVAYWDSSKTLRHMDCPILLDLPTRCQFCKRLSHTLAKKRMRILNSLIKKNQQIKKKKKHKI